MAACSVDERARQMQRVEVKAVMSWILIPSYKSIRLARDPKRHFKSKEQDP
jgi:hypothetical protein